MCNRYSLTSSEAVRQVLAVLGLAPPTDWAPRHNVAPTTMMPAVVQQRGERRVRLLSFGASLPPRGPGTTPLLLTNARSETMREKSSFRDAVQRRRCLVPADGFYEWERHGRVRQPHHFHRPDGSPFFFAGLWRAAADEVPQAFVIVTTAANAVVAPLHDRMPVIVTPADAAAWLGDEPLPLSQLEALCRPGPPELLVSHPVHPRVGQSRYEAPDCTLPWTPPPPEPTLFD